MVDAAFKAVLDIRSTCSPVAARVGDVVLHPGFGVDLELNWAYRSSQSGIDLTGIFIIIVIFGTVRKVNYRSHPVEMANELIDVLLRSVYTKSFCRDLELCGGISEA